MKLEKKDILKVEFKENVAIAELTTYKTAGYVKGVFYPKTERELVVAYSFLKDNNLPFIIVGNGSNLLISPKANILVISTKKLRQIAKFTDDEAVFSTSVPLAKAYSLCNQKGLKGFEGLAGIPATIGGAVKNNASAFGQSIFDYLEKIRVFSSGKIIELKKQDVTYVYHSTNLREILILSAKFKLKSEKRCKITQDFINYQKLRFSSQPKGLSCGSVFKNPSGLSAGKLIEQCGLKGKTHGNAEISEKHANFIINNGNATFDDIKFLIKLCQYSVKEQYNISLQPEVEIIE